MKMKRPTATGDTAIAAMFGMEKQMLKGLQRRWISVKPSIVWLGGDCTDMQSPVEFLIRAKDVISIEIAPAPGFIILVARNSTRIFIEPAEWKRVCRSFGVGFPLPFPTASSEEAECNNEKQTNPPKPNQ
jgi:hypothetical protein